MQTRELFFNGKSLDLSDATKIGVTLQANNLGELQNRQGEFTNTFKIPKTLRNRNILDHLDNISSVSVIPYRQNVVRYLEDGVEIIPEGTGTVESSDELYYYIKVTAGNLEFFNKFPDVKIYELDWEDQIHIRDFWTIKDSRANTSGYIYPIINWFDEDNTTAFDTNEINTRYLYPCMFLKDIFNKVDEVTGYTSKGSFIDWLETNEVVLSPKDSKMTQTAADGFKSLSTNTEIKQLGEIWAFDSSNVGQPPTYASPITRYPSFDISTNDMVQNLFTADLDIFGYLKFYLSMEVFYLIEARTINITLEWYDPITNVLLDFEIYPFISEANPGSGNAYNTRIISINYITSNITFSPGQQYAMRIIFEDPLVGTIGFNNLHLHL